MNRIVRDRGLIASFKNGLQINRSRLIHNSLLHLHSKTHHIYVCEAKQIRSYSWSPRSIFRKPIEIVENEIDTKNISDIEIDREGEDDIRIELNRNIQINGKLDDTKKLLLDLVFASPNNALDPNLYPLVQKAVRRLIPTNELTSQELYLIFKSIMNGSTKEDVQNYSFIGDIYEALLKWSLSDGIAIDSFVLFIKYSLLSSKPSKKIIDDINLFISESPQISKEAIESIINVIPSNPRMSLITYLFNLTSEKGYIMSKNFYSKLINILISKLGSGKLETIDKGTTDFDLSKIIEDIVSNSKNQIHNANDIENLNLNKDTIIDLIDFTINYNMKITGETILRLIITPILKSDLSLNLIPEDILRVSILLYIKFGVSLTLGKELLEKLSKYINQLTNNSQDLWDTLGQLTVHVVPEYEGVNQFLQKMDDTELIIDLFTYNRLLDTACTSNKPPSYIEKLSGRAKFYCIDRDDESFNILIKYALSHNDFKLAKDLVNESIQEGVDWNDSNMNILRDFYVSLCSDGRIDANEAQEWYNKLKMFTESTGDNVTASYAKLLVEDERYLDLPDLLKEEMKERVDWRDYPKTFKVYFDSILTMKIFDEFWAVYVDVINHFEVVPYESFLPIMKQCCRFGKPEAAMVTFERVRELYTDWGQSAPDEKMYTFLFQEFGKQEFHMGVYALHHQFKVDVAVEETSEVMNAILSAYCDLKEVWNMEHLFDKMAVSNLVNNESITLMLKARTRVSLSRLHTMWETIPIYDITPDIDNYRQLIVGQCYHGEYLGALITAREMEEENGIKPDSRIIEALYNWTMTKTEKLLVEDWATTNYPQIWDQLKEGGKLKEFVIDETDTWSEPRTLRLECAEKIEGKGDLQLLAL